MKSFVISNSRILGASLLTFVAAASRLEAGSIILDTTPDWDQMTVIGSFGCPDTATYGQTFLAPAGAGSLDEFTFFIQAGSGIHLEMRPVVFHWSGPLLGGQNGTAVGPALHVGAPISFDGDGQFQAVKAGVGNVPVTPGGAYVIGMTISDPTDYAASTGKADWGITLFQHSANTSSGGGGFVFFNNGDKFSDLVTVPWDHFDDYGDLAFTASFTAGVPDAGNSLAFVAVGLAGLSFIKRRATKS